MCLFPFLSVYVVCLCACRCRVGTLSLYTSKSKTEIGREVCGVGGGVWGLGEDKGGKKGKENTKREEELRSVSDA